MKRKAVAIILVLMLTLATGQTISAARAITVFVDGQRLSFEVSPVMESGRVLVPMRAIFERLGAQIEWRDADSTVIATTDDVIISLTIGNNSALINGTAETLDVPASVRNGRTLVPLRFVSQALGYSVEWDAERSSVFIGELPAPEDMPAINQLPAGASHTTRTATINNRNVQIVEIAPGALTPGIHIANNRIGSTQSMAQMVEQTGAVVAVNGTFFDAYTTEFFTPTGTLLQSGSLIHNSNIGTTLGFTADGRILMDAITIRIEGGINGQWGWPHNWYVYGINRQPPQASAAFMYTRHWGQSLGFAAGLSVTVVDGIVTSVVMNTDVSIPANGYVLNFQGGAYGQLGGRFSVGDRLDYRIIYSNTAFEEAVTAIGVGPRLVRDGVVAVDAQAEGFTMARILTESAQRSAIGIRADGTIEIITTSATIAQLAEIMLSLGAVNAMNLDGGASSGLYAQERFITRPGRNLSNMLYFR